MTAKYRSRNNSKRSTLRTRSLENWRTAARAQAARFGMVQRDWSGCHRARRLDRERRVSAWTSGIRQVRTLVALGGRRRGLASDSAQRRTDALHDGHRRTGVHRLHAHATALDVLGVVLLNPLLSSDGMAGLGGRRGRRGLLSLCEALAGERRSGDGLRDWRGLVSNVRSRV